MESHWWHWQKILLGRLCQSTIYVEGRKRWTAGLRTAHQVSTTLAEYREWCNDLAELEVHQLID